MHLHPVSRPNNLHCLLLDSINWNIITNTYLLPYLTMYLLVYSLILFCNILAQLLLLNIPNHLPITLSNRSTASDVRVRHVLRLIVMMWCSPSHLIVVCVSTQNMHIIWYNINISNSTVSNVMKSMPPFDWYPTDVLPRDLLWQWCAFKAIWVLLCLPPLIKWYASHHFIDMRVIPSPTQCKWCRCFANNQWKYQRPQSTKICWPRLWRMLPIAERRHGARKLCWKHDSSSRVSFSID